LLQATPLHRARAVMARAGCLTAADALTDEGGARAKGVPMTIYVVRIRHGRKRRLATKCFEKAEAVSNDLNACRDHHAVVEVRHYRPVREAVRGEGCDGFRHPP